MCVTIEMDTLTSSAHSNISDINTLVNRRLINSYKLLPAILAYLNQYVQLLMLYSLWHSASILITISFYSSYSHVLAFRPNKA